MKRDGESEKPKANKVSKIKNKTTLTESNISDAYYYLLINKHYIFDYKLERKTDRLFYEDYDIAQSWQRLIEGKDVKDHDITMIKHEAYEKSLMYNSVDYEDAHRKSNLVYYYQENLEKYNRESKK